MFGRVIRQSPARWTVKTTARRWVSDMDMLEAFSGSSTASKTGKPSNSTSDPVININADYSAGVNTAAGSSSSVTETSTLNSLFNTGLNDAFPEVRDQNGTNWSNSFNGLGIEPFSKESQSVLTASIPDNDIEITPDGLLYLPEIKYRRILNRAFGVGAWGLAPRSETLIQKQGISGLLTREYGMVVQGRLVSIARGEQTFFNEKGIPTATEGCKSNALMRCCKDLGIASELWDPRFIKTFKKKNCENIFVEYVPTKKKKKIWKRKDEEVDYPFKR